MVPLVAGTFKDAEEHEARGDGGVEHAEKDEGGNHKREGDFLEDFVSQRAEGGRGVVLGSRIDVDYGSHQAEEDDFANCNRPEGFGEILGLFHFCDEGGNGNLTDECVRDVQEGIHA